MPEKKDQYDLSLILACYNEEQIFVESVKQIVEVLDATIFSYEIIFVDDYSTDRTRDLIKETIQIYKYIPMRYLFHDSNIGRGRTVADGFGIAHGEIIGYIDIDLEVHGRYIPSFVTAIKNGFDIATALRIYTFTWHSLGRYILSKGYIRLVQMILGVPLRDTEAGFKFFNRQKLLPVLEKIQDPGWFWDTECLVKSHHQGLLILEIPCLFLRRFDKVSSVNPLKDSIQYFIKLIKFKKTLK